MLALSDDQLAIVMTAAGVLPPEKRSVFLERIAARLNLRDPRLPISDTDLSKAIRSALTGLAPAPPKLSGVIGYKEVIAERESTLIGPDRLTGDMSQAAASAVSRRQDSDHGKTRGGLLATQRVFINSTVSGLDRFEK
jgi:hypothetical protein